MPGVPGVPETKPVKTDKDDALLDPYEMIISSMETDMDDAMVLAEFVDTSAIVKAFQAIGYNLMAKVQALGDILQTGSPSQKMQAMDRLDEIKEKALERRGIFTSPRGSVKGFEDPLALPGSRSLEMTERTLKVTQEITDRVPAMVEPAQPMQEKTDGEDKEAKDGKFIDGQDSYFPDERGRKTVFRRACIDPTTFDGGDST